MHIYLFVSESDPSILAFTSSEDGSNIPPEHGPWRLAGNAIPSGVPTEAVISAVLQDGYFVVADRSVH